MKRGAVIGIVVGAVVLVAGGAGAWWALSRPPSPADTARAYLAALEKGDAKAALDLTDATDGARAQAEAAYAGATARLADSTVKQTSETAGTATVSVVYTLGGAEVSADLTLHDDGGWTIADGLGTITPTTTLGRAVTIGGTAVVTSGDTVELLPARYDVVATPAGILTGSTTADAAPGVETAVAVEASLDPGAAAVVQAQLDAYAQTCAKPATAVPPNCGLKVPWGADLSALKSLAFRIEKTPQVALAADASSFDATGGVVVATARGTARGGGEGVFTYRSDDWALRGSLSFDGAQLVLAVR